MDLKNNNSSKKFVTILSDGKFHQTVEEGTPNSVVREYEDSKGNKGSKTELVFSEASGYITDIKFDDGKFGKSMNIEMDNDGIISISTSSNFGEDVMKKLPNIDLDSVVTLKPYSFDVDGKNKKGVTIYQDGNKIESFYYDKDSNQVINEIPEPEGDTKKFSKDDWKMHFMVVRKFLIGEVEKLMDKKVRPIRESRPNNIPTIDIDDIEVVEDNLNIDVDPKDIPVRW